jgi:hypothetical protein
MRVPRSHPQLGCAEPQGGLSLFRVEFISFAM